MNKSVVIKEIGCNDTLQWAVAKHGIAYDQQGKNRRKVMFVSQWYATEDEARASAHRDNHPDY